MMLKQSKELAWQYFENKSTRENAGYRVVLLKTGSRYVVTNEWGKINHLTHPIGYAPLYNGRDLDFAIKCYKRECIDRVNHEGYKLVDEKKLENSAFSSGDSSIHLKHQEIYDYLMNLRRKDKTLFFIPRKKNNEKRLDLGYWFRGNGKYLLVSFWAGTDWKEKVHNISFAVRDDGESYIELAAQDSSEKAKFLELIANKLGSFKKLGKKNKWQRLYPGKNYMDHLESFLKNEKLVIDEMIRRHQPEEITFPNEAEFQGFINNLIPFMGKRQAQFVSVQKIARICWNTKGWKLPSGPEGKSRSSQSHEAKYGYGHEEWLLDRSRIINGFHYAFLEPLRVKSGKHVGKTYDISLISIDDDQNRFYAGDIKNAFCISNEEAEKVYKEYKGNGWLDEMQEQVEAVDGDGEAFLKNFNEFIFNVKFKFEDIDIFDEPRKISRQDKNITTSRFKLLPKIADFLFENPTLENSGNKGARKGARRNEKSRKAVINRVVIYDQQHSRFQNMLEEILKPEYSEVFLESNRVDITARTHLGKWHFFEVKIDTPKNCIRHAFGQILEYAYWPGVEKAERLIIVGDQALGAAGTQYLKYIRAKFSIPLYYRWLDFEKKALSQDF